jgi:translation initiation factor 5B
MATLKKNSASNSKKKAKGKKNKPDPISDDDAEPAEDKDNEFVATETRGVVEVNADDWMEAEFGETKAKKPKKGKKGGKSQQQRDNEEDEADPVDVISKGVETIEIAAVVVEKPVKEEQDLEEEETGSKVLSKSEKEKLKKEKEKVRAIYLTQNGTPS